MIFLEVGMSNVDNILQLIGIFILFIFILVITYYTTKFVGGVKLKQTNKGNFKVLETYKVAQNKYLQLVQVGTKYIVIAIGKDDIQFISELQESELIHQEPNVNQNGTFLEVLTKLTNKYNDKKIKYDLSYNYNDNQKDDQIDNQKDNKIDNQKDSQVDNQKNNDNLTDDH